MSSKCSIGPALTGITPHPHGRTGHQVYGGLAGLLIVSDKVGDGAGPPPELPDRLARLERHTHADADNNSYPRRFTLAIAHMQGVINGRVFVMQEVAPDETVRLGATEIWEFANDAAGMGMMMNMAHPMHIHAVQFQVVDRCHNLEHEDGGMMRNFRIVG